MPSSALLQPFLERRGWLTTLLRNRLPSFFGPTTIIEKPKVYTSEGSTGASDSNSYTYEEENGSGGSGGGGGGSGGNGLIVIILISIVILLVLICLFTLFHVAQAKDSKGSQQNQ